MSTCRAVVAVDGKKFSCELSAPHSGQAHHADGGPLGRIDWCSHGEARAVKR